MKKIINLKLVWIFLVCMAFANTGLSQKVELASFSVLTDNKKVYLNWVLAAGSTCNGMKVFSSLDTINFVEVGDISGICGSSSGLVGYEFTDEAPAKEKTIYYKIRFGFSQFSEMKTIKLETKNETNIIVRPNPASSLVTLIFNNEHEDVFNLKLSDPMGNVIFSEENIQSSYYSFDISDLANGQYFIQLIGSKGQKHKSQLIILK